MIPIAVSAGVLMVVAFGALFVYLIRDRDEPPTAQVAAETPSPIGGPAVSSPSPNAVVVESPELPAQERPTATPKRSPRSEEARQEPTPEPKATAEANADVEEHEGNPPDVPVPPDVQRPDRMRWPRTRVTPDGMVIQNLPDGSRIITSPNGMRVMVTKDGKRTVLNPPRPNRRPPAPAPTPSP